MDCDRLSADNPLTGNTDHNFETRLNKHSAWFAYSMPIA